MAPEYNFDYQDLDEDNVADLLLNVAVTLSTTLSAGLAPLRADAPLIGITSEEDGGIIAYAIGQDHADAMVRALRAAEGEYEAEMVSAKARI